MEPKAYTTEKSVPLTEKLFGPNWRTTVTGIGAAIMSLLTMLAVAPYELGELATVISPEWKKYIFGLGLTAAFVLRVLDSRMTKDRNVHGGNVLVDGNNNVLDRTHDTRLEKDGGPMTPLKDTLDPEI